MRKTLYRPSSYWVTRIDGSIETYRTARRAFSCAKKRRCVEVLRFDRKRRDKERSKYKLWEIEEAMK